MRPVVVSISGGLGSQLFQYAAGRAVAARASAPLLLDVSSYAGQPPGAFLLDRFNIDATVTALHPPRGLLGTVARGVRHVHPSPRWRNEQYFADVATQLRAELIPRAAPVDQSAALAREMSNCASVAVHVRPGDVPPPADYYVNAVEKVTDLVREPRLFVFSEDFSMARRSLPALEHATLLADNNAVEALWLMAHCRHHVIGNSSFAWWGAWLAEHAGQIVVAPEQSHTSVVRVAGIVPQRWFRL